MRINKDTKNLNIGDKVTTDFIRNQKEIVRTITRLAKSEESESGFIVCLDEGGNCPCCHRPLGTPLTWIDAGWAIPVKYNSLIEE